MPGPAPPALQPVVKKSPGFASNPRRVGERKVSAAAGAAPPAPIAGVRPTGTFSRSSTAAATMDRDLQQIEAHARDVLALVHRRSNLPAVVAQGIEATGREEAACRIGMAIHPGC